MVAVAIEVKFVFHHESKMSPLSTTIWAQNFQCILVGLLLDFLHVGNVGLSSHGVSFGNGKRPQRTSMPIASMVVVSVLSNRLMACACGSRVLVKYANN